MNKHMKKIYDVGLVTVSGNNYGNNITNLALFTYIKELGYKSATVFGSTISIADILIPPMKKHEINIRDLWNNIK